MKNGQLRETDNIGYMTQNENIYSIQCERNYCYNLFIIYFQI